MVFKRHAAGLQIVPLNALWQRLAGIGGDDGVHAASRAAVDDAGQPACRAFAEVHREIGDDQKSKRLGNFAGGFVAAFLFAEIISLGGLYSDLEWGYVLAFAFFIVMMFIRPAGLLARRS